MLISKRCLILISFLMLILMLMPMSFANDLNDTIANGIDMNESSSDIVKYSEGDDIYINLDKTEIDIEEGESDSISGDVHVDIYDGPYSFELTMQCSYTDADNILRTYTAPYDGSSFNFDVSAFEGLKAKESPYILTISIVEDDLYENNLLNDFSWIDGVSEEIVYLTVNSNDDPLDVIPTYETFEKQGEIYVSNDGNDSYDGSDSTPFATIQRALDENKALGGGYEIIVNSGQYYIQTYYTISNNVRITGKGNVTISNEGQNYLFFLSGPNVVEFINLKIMGGRNAAISGSATVNGLGENSNDGKVLNIVNCTFEDNDGWAGVIVTYSKTTILNSTFIKNEATGTSGIFQGLISARDGYLTVNYCNFIDNTVGNGKPVIYSGYKGNANFNFWGTNLGPKDTDIVGNVKVKTWVGILPKLNDNEIVTGEDYNITIEYKYTNDTGIFKDLSIAMPNLDVDVESAIGELTPSTVAITDNVNVTYSSNVRGNEIVSVRLNGVELSHINFVVNAALGDRIYVSTNGSDSNSGSESNPLKTVKAAILKNNQLGGDKTIIVLPGEYREYDLEITNNVTIMAEKEGTVTINALKSGRILVVDANANITNLTFKNAFVEDFDDYYGYGGAIFHNSGKLTVTNCSFENNLALNGGAIASWATQDDLLEIYDSSFKSNTISEYSNDLKGSAIFSQSNMLIDNSVFVQNSAEDVYGTVYLGESANITNSVFIANEASEGAAIYVEAGNKAIINIENNEFALNNANNGGAVYVALSNMTVINNNTFDYNMANKGGAIYLYGASSANIVKNNNFTDNSIYLRSANAQWDNNVINNDDAQIIIDGGHISQVILTYLKNETVKVQNGSIEINATF